MKLNYKQIFIDSVRLYFAPLIGAIKGANREWADEYKRQQQRRKLQSTIQQ